MGAKHLYEFGPFRLDPAERRLLRDDQPVALTPKCFDLLVVLVENSGHLLGKDELLARLWPGQFVEEANLSFNVSSLRKALGEGQGGRRYIETVPKKGFRFVGHVEVSRVNETEMVENQIEAPPAKNSSAQVTVDDQTLSQSKHLSNEHSTPAIRRIVVLPFRMLRADADLNFLAFSLPDTVAGTLSLLGSLVVLTPHTHEVPNDSDLKRIGEESKAEAALTGTILRAGSGIRVTCQLLEIPTATILWWHESQVSLTDLFELQDNLVRGIVESLSLSLTANEHGRLKRDVPGSATAYEFYLRGNELSRRGLAGFGDLKVARDLYLRSVEIDSHYAPAWAQLGRCYRLIGKGMENATANRELAESAFRRALDLNIDLPIANSQFAFLEAELGRAPDAVARLLSCVKSGSVSPDIFVALVLCCRFCGLLEASVAAHEHARNLDPLVATSVSHTHYQLANYDSALRDMAIGEWGIKGITLGTMGRTAEAIETFRRLEESGLPPPMRACVVAWRAMFEGNHDECLQAAEHCIQDYLDPEGMFYMGLIMSRIGAKDRALTVLNQSMDRGFSSFKVLERNPWFDNLRKTAKFDVLLSRAELRLREARQTYEKFAGSLL